LTSKPKPTDTPSGTLDASALPAEALSGPNLVRYRAVTEGDIARLKLLEKPASLVAAALFAGIFLACSYPVYQFFTKIDGGQNAATMGDLAVVVAWSVAFGVAVTASLVSVRRQSKVISTLEAMAKRPSVPVNQPVNVRQTVRAKRSRFGFRRKKVSV